MRSLHVIRIINYNYRLIVMRNTHLGVNVQHNSIYGIAYNSYKKKNCARVVSINVFCKSVILVGVQHTTIDGWEKFQRHRRANWNVFGHRISLQEFKICRPYYNTNNAILWIVNGIIIYNHWVGNYAWTLLLCLMID